jgi:hypothetical protein
MSTTRFALAALCALVATLLAGVVDGSAQPTVGREGDGLNLQLPGLQASADIADERLRAFKAHGYDWITYQAQNGKRTDDVDLAPAKAAGLGAGVWGVSYSQSAFFVDGLALGRQALKLRAEHVMMNVELAAKGTLAARGMKPIIEGLRAAGWTGPVHLNTLGPPVDPEANDYELDLASFLETGGGVLTQAYYNETEHYRPSRAARYYTRVGVPRDRLNLAISIMPAESDKQKAGTTLRGARWVPLLKEARLGRAFSIFLAEAVTGADLRALDRVIDAPPPKPGTDVDVSGNRAASLERLAASIADWRAGGLSEESISLQRQTLAWRVLSTAESGPRMRALLAALDLAQAPPIPALLPSKAALGVAGGNRGVALERLEASLQDWRRAGLPEESLALQRQALAWRTLNTLSTRVNVVTLRTVLDQVRAPRP